ncbi:hypothetical protein F8M41_020159 [Gigaspora margarita]|uniref:Uncharacterized protein n=1 Tax=Gigaspora margarita TaxID=4874 RepID=A0A8H4EJV4_GIGMA|nr:hypothetical protein F8M41_020159 [Gigaspora margarita]
MKSFCMFIDDDGDIEPKITDVAWLPGNQFNVTVQSPKYVYCEPICGAPIAIGHFTFKSDDGQSERFSKYARFVKGLNDDNFDCCASTYKGQNPYSMIVGFDEKNKPSFGSNVTVALSIYYNCYLQKGQLKCRSCDAKYYSTMTW